MVTVTEQAIDTTNSWLQRLTDDKQAISDTFASGLPVGRVTEVNSRLSDPHNSGQTVWFVEFESGLQVAYKPRSFAPDLAYLEFLQWLNQHQPTLTLRAAPVLARSGYGWAQWIETSECNSKDEVALYYRRQGAHIALFYFLSGNDFHEENFVAAGSFPIPIDLETLGAHALTHTSQESDDDITNQLPYFWRTYDSVFSTVMLPRWVNHPRADVEALVASALSERGSQDIWPVPIPIWRNLRTDEMSLTFEYRVPRAACPLPRHQGEAVSAVAYIDDVLKGFTQTYQVVLAHRSDLLGTSSPLKGFENLPTRALIRPTEVYTDLLFFTTAPDNLTSGAAYDVALEMVCGLPISDEEREGALTYSQLEKQALWSRDIPYFSGSTSDCYLYAESGDRFGPVNTFSGYDNICKRIQTASAADLQWQQELLRASMAMMLAPKGTVLDLRPNPVAKVSKSVASLCTLDTAVTQRISHHILEIALRIDSQKLSHNSGTSWLTLGLYGRFDIPQLGQALPWTTTGNAGIAVFLCNLAAYTQDDYWADLAHQALKTVVDLVEQQKLQTLLAQSGLYCGLSGVLYSLQTCATKLNNEDYLHQAHRLAIGISLDDWANVQNPDLIGGASANLLALLHLYDKVADDALIERAIAIGRQILSYQKQSGIDAGGFCIPHAPRPLLGMGHGAAGIVYALSRLYAITSDTNWSLDN